MDIAKELKKRLGTAFLENEPMSKHVTFKIGGPARYYVNGKTKEVLMAAFKAAMEFKLPYFILGNGSNILIADKGYDGLVINVKNEECLIEGEKVFCGAGLPNAILVKKTVDAGLTGCEWAIAVPGSVGGSVRGNAGAYGGDFSKITELVESYDGDQILPIHKTAAGFAYRESVFKRKHKPQIILSAVLNLNKASDKALPRKLMLEYLNKKNAEHPMGLPSAGCIFKNVELLPGSCEMCDPALGRPSNFFKSEVPAEFVDRGNVPAGFLIEAVDLKGSRIGGVEISVKHANYIVNTCNGKAEDVMILISIIKQKVRTAFGVQLKEEIELVGF